MHRHERSSRMGSRWMTAAQARVRRPPLSAGKWKLENRGLQIIAATSAATFGPVGSELGVRYTATTWRCDGGCEGWFLLRARWRHLATERERRTAASSLCSDGLRHVSTQQRTPGVWCNCRLSSHVALWNIFHKDAKSWSVQILARWSG